MNHPMQPLVRDEKGIIRFKENKIIRWLFESGKLNLNELALMVSKGMLPKEDYAQLTQLLGYSVSGWGDISTSPRDQVMAADAEAAKMILKRDNEDMAERTTIEGYDIEDKLPTVREP